MTAEIHNLNCITRLDIPADRVLQAALDAGLQAVIIVGWNQDGQLYTASSYADGGDALWLVEKFKKRLLEIADEN
jgi:hypothetical protein